MGAWREVMLAAIGDATPEERARIVRIAFRIVVAIHILWVCGMLSPIGFAGAVFADDVDGRVQMAIEPVRAELGKVATQVQSLDEKVTATNELVTEVLIGNLANQLRDLNRLRCTTADDVVRARMEKDIEDGERKYIRLTGARYPLPACKDL